MKKRLLAVLLTAAMLFSVLPASALAAEGDEDSAPVCAGLEGCTEDAHDEECPLYAEPVEGGGDTNSYYEFEDVYGIDEDTVVISQIQARIDALPGVDTLAVMDTEEQAEVYAEVCAIYDAIDELTDDEAGALDVSALEEAAAFFTRQIMPLDNVAATAITAAGGELASGDYQLTGDITLTTDLTIPTNTEVTIDLNGHTLTGSGSSSVITVYGKLTLNDTTATKQSGLSSATAGVVSNGTGSWTVTYIIYDENDNSSYSTYTAGAITGGVGGNDCGGGIHVAENGTVTMNGGIITNCKVSENQQYALGGGIYLAKNSSFTMSDGAISGNTAKSSVSSNGQGSGGGVYVAPNSTFSMTGGVFSSNKAEGANANGGAVFSQGTFTAENAVFSGNTSAHWTGGIVGKVTLKNCVLVDNQTGTVDGSYGGALSGGGNIEACIISHNSAQGEGGGVYLNEDTEIKTSYIQYNTAGSGGGGISVAAKSSTNVGKTIKINASYVRNNTAGTENANKSGGGGIKLGINNVMTLTDTEVSQNSAFGNEVYGGGVYNDNGELTIGGDTNIVENVNKGSSKSLGGGVFTGRNTIVTGGEIQKNTAKQGGGIYVADQKFSMSGGSITHNHADESGGGIYVNAATPAFSGSVVVKDNTAGESKTVDNLTFISTNTTYKACLSGALTDGAEIGIQVTNSKNTGREVVVAQSDSEYSITASDLSHFVYDGDGYALYFDTSTNSIKMETAVTVTFNANTGDNSATATQKVPFGQNAALNANTFTRTGYTFTGWSTQQGGGETAYADKATINISTDTTLYAQWTLDTPTVTVSADKTSIVKNSGTATLTATAEHGAEGVTYEYQWYKGTPDNGAEISGATSQTYAVNNLTSDTTYYCKVTAVNGNDKSEATTSNAVTISVANAEGSVDITNDKTTATYGEEPFTFTYTASGTATVESSDTSVATVSDSNGTVTVAIVGAGNATISVSSAASAEYTAASAAFTLTVAKATLTITADNQTIYVGGTLPTAYTYTVSGLVGGDTESVIITKPIVTCSAADANTANTYTITASGADAGENYTITYVDGTLTVSRRSSGGGGGSSSSSNTTTETVTNKDGSTTTTVTDKKTGTVTETTKYKDGSTLVVETKKDGTVTTTETAANGVKVKTVDEPGEDVTAAVTIPRSVGTATVTIPADTTPGTVAVDTKTGEIVKLSVPTEDGMTVKLDGSANLVLEDRSKNFTDTNNHWAEDAIDFATAHGMFSGTSATTFTPDGTMTRGMIAVVLHNFDDNPDHAFTGSFEDVHPTSWYADGIHWMVDSGIAGGYGDGRFGAEDKITREQLATFLYNFAKVKGYDVSGRADLGRFTDGSSVSSYATETMSWAVDNGLFGGMGDGTLAPQGNATRAQVATILMRFVENLTK